MDKKEALKILIENSFVLDQETKTKFLMAMDSFTEEEIDELGKLFAHEQNVVKENKEELQSIINSL